MFIMIVYNPVSCLLCIETTSACACWRIMSAFPNEDDRISSNADNICRCRMATASALPLSHDNDFCLAVVEKPLSCMWRIRYRMTTASALWDWDYVCAWRQYLPPRIRSRLLHSQKQCLLPQEKTTIPRWWERCQPPWISACLLHLQELYLLSWKKILLLLSWYRCQPFGDKIALTKFVCLLDRGSCLLSLDHFDLIKSGAVDASSFAVRCFFLFCFVSSLRFGDASIALFFPFPAI